MIPRSPTRGVYAITPDESDTARLVERVDTVLAAGADLLQYRNKSADSDLRHRQALALRELCRAHAVPLIINDNWRLAAAIGADGVHLGEDDAALATVRRTLGDAAIVGASCYDRFELATRAVDAGASYVAFGAFFASPSKPHARRASPQLLQQAGPLAVPRVAIGGITPDNARSLIEAGADFVAVISGVFDAADPAAATRAYRACFEPLPPATSQ